jgi:hypothetical protein
MANEFPMLVYVSPGKYQAGHGNSFDHEPVNSEEELRAALAAGFYKSVPEAIEAHKNPKKIEAPKNPKGTPDAA